MPCRRFGENIHSASYLQFGRSLSYVVWKPIRSCLKQALGLIVRIQIPWTPPGSASACTHPGSHLLPLTITTHEGGSNRVKTRPAQLWLRCLSNINPILKSHILFKARVLSSSLPRHQPKGDRIYLCFQYYSRCWNPPSPITQFTLFLSLSPIL